MSVAADPSSELELSPAPHPSRPPTPPPLPFRMASPLTTSTPTPAVAVAKPPGLIGRTARSMGSLIANLGRLTILAALCGHHLTSIFAIGWTFRLIRRNIFAGWHRRSEDLNKPTLDELLNRIDPDGPPASRRFPRLFASERPGRGRLGSLRKNISLGVMALICSFAFTLPGELFMWYGWELGWLISFHKLYEQAFAGRTLFIFGMFLFVAAMCYLPMAWGHFAASGDPRAFFQFKLISRLVRRTPGKNLMFALAFGLLLFVISVARITPMFWGNALDADDMTAAQIQQWRNAFNFYTGFVALFGFVVAHTLAARMYRKALLELARRDPDIADQLPAPIRRTLEDLTLIPSERPRAHPVIALAVGTGRVGAAAWLWPTLIVVWTIAVFLVPVAAFFNYNYSQNWLNQPLVNFPSLNSFPLGAP